MSETCLTCLVCAFTCAPVASTPQSSDERIRYVRGAAGKFVTECEFVVNRGDAGWSIVSLTDRGNTKLTIVARYDRSDRLTAAEAVLAKADSEKLATVKVTDSTATVERAGEEGQMFEVPAGVIVTSAPDWTDTFLLCQRYDRRQGGKQQFAGLWIHPEQPAQRLTFTIERLGADTIEHNGEKIELARFEIRLRGNSPYVAWADPKGRMIKLSSLPFKVDSLSGLVLEGYEKSAAELRPPP